MRYEPLPIGFYETTPYRLARRLIGTLLVRIIDNHILVGRITETEAYGGADDPASHAYRGVTERNRVMFKSGGYAYVYFTYGMHYCFNIVAGKENGEPGAVLIRAAEPLSGIEMMKKLRGKNSLHDLLTGPAKLCQSLAIDRQLNGIRLDQPPLFITRDPNRNQLTVRTTPRIGIKAGLEKKWRFVNIASDHISVRP